jgi:general secretion pathway protein E
MNAPAAMAAVDGAMNNIEPPVESEQLRRFAGVMRVPVIDAAALPETVTPLEGVPADFFRRHGILPLGIEDGRLKVAIAVPPNFAALDGLRQFANVPVDVSLAPRADIEERLQKVYEDAAAAREAGQSSVADLYGAAAGDNPDGDDDDLETLKALAEDAPVVRLVQHVIYSAAIARASDIHLEIFETHFRVRYRIDGVLFDMEAPPRRLYLPAISHLKLRARMNIAERRLPQDGRIKMAIQDREVDMRVSTIPTVYGESMVIRILDQGPGLLELEALGFEPDSLKLFQDAIDQPHGMILVTGPTGSGKTTSLYAALSRINNPQNKIITVEDPVEYQIDGINQMQVKAQIDLTFANSLRSIVRQDPDVIMIGEIRDRETAEIAIQAALTGHLVFSTLHTNDSFGAPHRLLDMGVESYLLASSVVLILAQRLVRMICKHCRHEVPVSESDRLFLEQNGFAADGAKLYHGSGCAQCANTGYSGRQGIYELLPMTSAIKEGIIKKLSAEGLRQIALAEGVRPMRADGIMKALAGITTLEELARVTRQED